MMTVDSRNPRINSLLHEAIRRGLGALTVGLVLCFAAAPDVSGRERPRDRERGERPWRVRHVDFSGNTTFSRFLLHDRIVTTPSRPFNRVPYSERVLADDIRVLQSFYRNQGFLEARVTLHNVHLDSARRRVSVVVVIEENKRTHVRDVSFAGNTLVDSAELARLVKSSPKTPLRSTIVDADASRIVALYGKRGYLQASVRPTVSLAEGAHVADIRFEITQNGASVCTSYSIEGLRRVKAPMVEREMRVKRGDTITTGSIRASVDGLYRTGLFARASVTPVLRDSISGDEVPGDGKEIVVRVEEHDLFDVGLGVGYATEEQLRGSIDAAYRNLFGRGKRIAIGANASFAQQKGEVVYTDPRFLGLAARLDLAGQIGHYDHDAYEAVIGGVRAGLSFTAPSKLGYRIRLRFDENRYVPLSRDTAKPTQSLYASVSWDRRDDVFAPNQGTFVSLQAELAGLGGSSTNQFASATLDIRGHKKIRKSWVVSSGLRTGYVHEWGSSPDVPLQDRFYCGGNSSVRGFRTRMVGPLERLPTVDGADTTGWDYRPVGGRFLVELHPVEIRAQIYKILYGNVFFDCGTVYNSPQSFSFRTLRYSAGFGLSARLALGVVRAEVGFPLERNGVDPDEPWAYPHLDIGYAF